MTRKLSDLNVRCLILGGGWAIRKANSLPKTYLDKNTFYTVDINPKAKPDAVFDFTNRAAWKAFPDSSFDFIIFEAVPFVRDIQIAFEECQRILSNTGVVFYRGGCVAEESMLDIFKRANFTQCVIYVPPVVSREDVELYKMEQGMLSFASKSPLLLTQGYMQQHLPKLALEAVRFHISDITKNMAEMSVNQEKHSKAVDSAIHFSSDFLFGSARLEEAQTQSKEEKVSPHSYDFWQKTPGHSLAPEQDNVAKSRCCIVS